MSTESHLPEITPAIPMPPRAPKGWLGNNSIDMCEAQVCAILQEWLTREHGLACCVTSVKRANEYGSAFFRLALSQPEEEPA